jgi:hypothetical protein
MSLLAFLQAKKYSSSGRVHVAPNIPKKLLSNALAAYDLTLDPSDVVVLIDDTMFGSGKDGCLIGHDCLAIRETFSDAVSYAYSEVQSLEIQGSKLFLNKRQAIAFNMPDKADLNQCFTLVLEWMRSQSADQPSAKRAEVKAAAGSQELNAAQVDAVVQMTVNLAERLGLERVYVRPHIPQKKLQAALESYGANMREDEVLVLIDDTLFGGAKEGVLMGESKLALKMVFEAPRLFFWRHLEGLSVEKRDLYINARKVGSFTQVGEKELGEFFSLIDQALVDARQTSADDIPLPQIVESEPEPAQAEKSLPWQSSKTPTYRALPSNRKKPAPRTNCWATSPWPSSKTNRRSCRSSRKKPAKRRWLRCVMTPTSKNLAALSTPSCRAWCASRSRKKPSCALCWKTATSSSTNYWSAKLSVSPRCQISRR